MWKADVWGSVTHLCSCISGICFYVVTTVHDRTMNCSSHLNDPTFNHHREEILGKQIDTISLQTGDNGDNLHRERRVAFAKKEKVTAERISLAGLIMLRNV